MVVVFVVAGAADRAGEHAGGDESAFEADEHLGRRADETVDGEHPRVRVGVGTKDGNQSSIIAQRSANLGGIAFVGLQRGHMIGAKQTS